MRIKLLQLIPLARVMKWVVVGLAFMAFNLPLLYLLVEAGKLPVPAATSVLIITSTILRFLANDRLVFQHARPSWQRFKNYCASISLGLGIWYTITNILTLLHLHYILAAITATACSVTINLILNFLWVWRDQDTNHPSYSSYDS